MSATAATLIHDAISNPTEVIKQRLQMYDSPYKSVVDCAKRVFQQEGISAFYRSYTTQLVMNLPYQALHFTTYEFFQEMVSCFETMRNVLHENTSKFITLLRRILELSESSAIRHFEELRNHLDLHFKRNLFTFSMFIKPNDFFAAEQRASILAEGSRHRWRCCWSDRRGIYNATRRL